MNQYIDVSATEMLKMANKDFNEYAIWGSQASYALSMANEYFRIAVKSSGPKELDWAPVEAGFIRTFVRDAYRSSGKD